MTKLSEAIFATYWTPADYKFLLYFKFPILQCKVVIYSVNVIHRICQRKIASLPLSNYSFYCSCIRSMYKLNEGSLQIIRWNSIMYTAGNGGLYFIKIILSNHSFKELYLQNFLDVLVYHYCFLFQHLSVYLQYLYVGATKERKKERKWINFLSKLKLFCFISLKIFGLLSSRY